MGILTQTSNSIELVKFLEKNSKTLHSNGSSHIEGNII
jgi:hypothetical protein